jgi:hypothetical protein
MVLTVLAIVVIILFTLTGALKIFRVPASLEIRDALDVPPGLWTLIGVLEWLGVAGVVAGFWYHALGLAACIGFSCLLVGALLTRLRASQRHERSDAAGMAADSVTLLLSIATAVAFAWQL